MAMQLSEDKLELYLFTDANKICYELIDNGIVFENQFDALTKEICEKKQNHLSELFSQKLELEINPGFDKITNNFFFFDADRYTIHEAVEKSISYQKSCGNY